MWRAAVDQAQQEVAADPNDLFASFNLGSSLSAMGSYADAATAFDRARAIGLPPRMLWYQFEPFAAYLAVGRTADVLAWPIRRWRRQRASRKFIIGAGGRWPCWAR